MKFNSILIVALLALITFFTSCEKAADKGGGTIKGSCKISAVTGYYANPLSILYDSAGRIDTMITVGLLRRYKYEDSGRKVTIFTEGNNISATTTVLTYNPTSKLLDTARITYTDRAPKTITYAYQNNNMIAEYIHSGLNVDTITYMWSGGNMVSMHPSSGLTNSGSITYHTQMAFQEGDFNYMNSLIEKGYVPVGKTANLVQANYSGNINYKFNSNGYIKQASSVHDGYPTVTYTYEYTCK